MSRGRVDYVILDNGICWMVGRKIFLVGWWGAYPHKFMIYIGWGRLSLVGGCGIWGKSWRGSQSLIVERFMLRMERFSFVGGLVDWF